MIGSVIVLSGCAATPPIKNDANKSLQSRVASKTLTRSQAGSQVHNAAAQKAAFDELDVEMGLKKRPVAPQKAVQSYEPINKPASITAQSPSKEKATQRIVGNGYGENTDLARRDALNNLASSIQINVSKIVASCTNHSGDCGSVVKVNTHTNLPILGAQYQRLANEQGSIRFQVWLDNVQALPLYIAELDRQAKKINKNKRLLARKLKPAVRYRVLSSVVNLAEKYDKHRLVANALGGYKNPPRPDINLDELKHELERLEGKAGSLAFAAKTLTKGITEQAIYLQPPRPKNSQEVTPFAAKLNTNIRQGLKTVTRPELAKYTLEGEYNILIDGDIFIRYNLVDLDYNVLKTKSVTVEKSAYKGLRAKPQAVSFEALLNDNIAVSNEFQVELKTLQGSNSLNYKARETIRLLVRLNKAGYYYIIGHVTKQGEQLSYLLDLNDGSGNEKFIRHIPQDQANKYMEVATFEVTPPFGVEHLQVIASNKKIKQLPSYYDNGDYFILKGSKGNAAKGVSLTRALKRKQNKGSMQTTEATLTYTTHR